MLATRLRDMLDTARITLDTRTGDQFREDVLNAEQIYKPESWKATLPFVAVLLLGDALITSALLLVRFSH